MGNRLLSIGAIVLAGLFWWGVSYVVTPNNGDAEFQKMLDATQQVKSFRGTFAGNTPNTQHSERLWELDCKQGILHKQSKELANTANAVETTDDEFVVGSDQKFTRKIDGSWENTKYTATLYSASWYCETIPKGNVRDLLPDVRAMIRSASIGKGDKKTVNGVRCQDWKFSMQSMNSGARGTVCIGIEDHLPYEMTTENGGRYSYSDYNQPLQFDAPEAVLQSVSATGGSN